MDIAIDFFKKNLFHHDINVYLGLTIAIFLLFTLAWFVGYISKNYLAHFLSLAFEKTKNHWMTLINKHALIERFSRLVPVLFIYWSVNFIALKEIPLTFTVVDVVKTLSLVFVLLIIARAISDTMDVVYEHSRSQWLENRHRHPIKSYIQIFKIILWFFTIVFSISILLDKSPWIFLTGLGAVSAVLVIVFKDTILGFVANIQVSAYDLVREGDWITIDQHGVDGTVFDISVNTVKVRNFDNTIATIPTYDLVSCNVQNWRGMTESGGRRIKRSIKIDMNSICFFEQKLWKNIEESSHIDEEVKDKLRETLNHEAKHSLTNMSFFRGYVKTYLSLNKAIRADMTLLVRYLQATETGLPLEIYIFTNAVEWEQYEAVVANIIDHLLAVLPLCHLKPFQLFSSVPSSAT